MLSRMTLALVAICVLLASSVSAETGKIGLVDTQQALLSTELGKKAKEELEQKLRSAQSQLQPKIDRLQQMEKELQEMQAVGGGLVERFSYRPRGPSITRCRAATTST